MSLESERWQKARQLFESAVEIPTEGREAYLVSACGDDEELLAEVVSLIQADGEAHDLLDGVAAEALEVSEESVTEGTRIGAYRIIEKIGAGGMGNVYLAERADGAFRQQVALKLTKQGMDSEEVLRRFKAERQILAQLQHEHIARLLDGGVHADGRPFFSMEFVAGEPITTFCDRHRLSVDQRLDLFCTVCSTVQYAQENLVVHRDLKPSNILVTTNGTVKLLDFGIAKLLSDDASASEHQDLTRTGLRIMTPGYASPEQVRGEAVTTATDVYSLGVVLFELLTGTRPFQLRGLTPRQMEDLLDSTEPPRPSTNVVTARTQAPDTVETESTPEELSRLRSTVPERLSKRLSGDLDNICLQALRRDPERRYKTAGQLLEDLQRHVDGKPVKARPDTLRYRAQKFMGRHKTSVGVALAMLGLVASLVVFYTVRLAGERDLARQEADKAEAVSRFLASMFEVADPTESRGAEITAREMLDSGAARIEAELADQPAVQAEMFTVVGNVYRNLGEYTPARRLIEQALAIRQGLYGPNHPDVATSLSRFADILYYTGDFDSCRAVLGKSLALKRELYGEMHKEVALELNNLGWLAYESGDWVAADSMHTRALTIRRQLFGEEHVDVAESLGNLASVAYGKGEYDAAEKGYRRSLEMYAKILGDDHPLVATQLANHGLALEALERYDEAEACYRKSADLCRQIYGSTSHQVADAVSFVGRVNHIQRRYEEATPHYREALELRRTALGPDHYLVGYDLKNLAENLHARKLHGEAEDALFEALRIYRTALPEGHTYTAAALVALGMVLTETGRAAEAEPHLRRAVAIRRASSGAGDWSVASAQSDLGHCLTLLKRFPEADSVLSVAFTTLETIRGEDDRWTQQCIERIVQLYDTWGKPSRAETYRARLAPKS